MILFKIIRQFKLQAIREIKVLCCLQGMTYCCVCRHRNVGLYLTIRKCLLQKGVIFCSLLLAGLACLGSDELWSSASLQTSEPGQGWEEEAPPRERGQHHQRQHWGQQQWEWCREHREQPHPIPSAEKSHWGTLLPPSSCWEISTYCLDTEEFYGAELIQVIISCDLKWDLKCHRWYSALTNSAVQALHGRLWGISFIYQLQ